MPPPRKRPAAPGRPSAPERRPRAAAAGRSPPLRALGGPRKRPAARGAAVGCGLCPRRLAEAARAGVGFEGRLDGAGSELRYAPGFAGAAEAAAWFSGMQRAAAWAQGTVTVFGRAHPEPRLTCYYGDAGLSYRYSGRSVHPLPWSACPPLGAIRQRVEAATGERFNSVLCNRYRSGDDTVGWHADSEALYGPCPTIASVSLGAARDFDLREAAASPGARKLRVRLQPGSLLVMRGQTQHLWQHCLPRRKKVSEERINLTFRKIVFPGA